MNGRTCLSGVVALALAAGSTPVLSADPALPDGRSNRAPSESCDRESIQKLAPLGTTVAFAAREYGGCRISGYVTNDNPGPNQVLFTLALPSNFNGRYVYLGVGGAAGLLPVMKPSLLAKGYALAGSDGGTGAKDGADFSFKSDEGKLTDFLWRGVKTTAEATQQITRGYYGRQKISRFISGCSGGGQMGISNAIRFGNANFDGFISAATPWPGVAFKANVFSIVQHLQNHPEGWISPEMLDRANAAILARYDESDGARDAMIADVRNIKALDGAFLRELGFTRAQIVTFNLITAPGAFSGPGIYGDGLQAGFPVSTMASWPRFLLGTKPPPWPNTTQKSVGEIIAGGAPFYHTMADTNVRSQKPGLDYVKITDRTELVSLSTRGGTEGASSDFDFSKLAASGAKMIVWHGSYDEANPYLDNLKAYETIVARNPSAPDWLRFFVVPGTQHCAGGNGPTDIEGPLIEALAAWVEAGKAPDFVLAPRSTPEKGIDRVFRLCPEPKRAVLKTQGLDPNAAENWECRTPA